MFSNLPAHEQLISCPYNKAHQVVAHRSVSNQTKKTNLSIRHAFFSRMPNHLMKCRRSHGTHGTKQCRFNSSHVVAIEEIKVNIKNCEITWPILIFSSLQYHEENCPERLLIELMQSNNQPCNQPRESMSKDSGMGATISSFASVSQQDENWDDLVIFLIS